MPQSNLPLSQLNAAVQSAIEQVLAKHGGGPVEKLWVGFVAPEQIATLDNATKIASHISKEIGVQGTPSVAQLGGNVAPGASGAAGGSGVGGGHAVHTEALQRPGHIIGLVYNPQLLK